MNISHSFRSLNKLWHTAAMVLWCVLCPAALQAATITSTATGGSWTNGTTWVGGIAPATTDDVVIATTTGNSVSLTGNTECRSLTINTGATFTQGSHLLTISGDYINLGGTFTTSTTGIVITGTANQQISGFTTTGPLTITKTGGTATFAGNFSGTTLTINGAGGTLNLGTNRTHTLTGVIALTAGTLNGGSSTINASVTGNVFSGTGTNFVPGTSTFILSGVAQTINLTITFNNLTYGGTGVKTIAASTTTTVNGLLTIANAGQTNVFNGTLTYGPNSGLVYNAGSSNRTVAAEWPATFTGTAGVTIAGTGIITLNTLARQLGNNTSVPLILSAGGRLNTNSQTLTFHGDFINNGTFTAGSSAITFAGTVATQNTSGFTTNGIVSMTKTAGTVNATNSITAAGLTINGAGGTLNLGSFSHTINSTGNVALTAGTLDASSATLSVAGNISGSATFITTNMNLTLALGNAQSILGYTSTGTLTVTKTTGTATMTGNLSVASISNTGAGTLNLGTGPFTHNISGNITNSSSGSINLGSGTTVNVTGNITNSSTGNINLGTNNTINVSGTITQTNGTLNLGTTTTVNLTGTGTVISGTIAAGSSTVVLAGAAQTIATANTFNNLTFAGTGSKTASGALTINGLFTIANGTNANTLGTVTYTNTGSLRYDAGSANRTVGAEWPGNFLGIAPPYTGSGVTIAGTGTITLNGNKLLGTTAATGSNVALTINAGATLATGNVQLNLQGNFTNNGTLNAGSSNIIFERDLTQTVTGPITTTGTITCNKTAAANQVNITGAVSAGNFTITQGSLTTLTAASTLTVSGTLTMSATSFIAGGNINTGILTMNGGTLSTNTGVTLTVSSGTFTMNNGIFTANGNITAGALTHINGTINIGSGLTNVFSGIWTRTNGTITLGNNSSIEFSGSISGTGGTLTTNPGSTVIFSANGAQNGCPATTYNNLIVRGSGLKTFAATPTVNGTFTLEGTATVEVTGVPTFNYGPSATLRYNKAAASNTTNEEFPSPFLPDGGVIIANTGTVTFNALKSIGGPLNINTGASVNLGAGVTHDCFGLILGASGTLNGNYGGTGSGATNIDPVFFAANTGQINSNNLAANWTGAISTDWHTAGNWSTNSVPTAARDVVIPAAPPNQPVLSAAAACQNLTINGGASLTSAGFQLTLTGNLVNNGTLILGASNIVITGNENQTIDGFITTGNISMTKTGGTATFNGNVQFNTLTLDGVGGTLNLGTTTRTHTFTGNITVNNGTLQGGTSNLIITDTATQSIASVNLSTGTITMNKTGGTATFSGDITAAALTINGVGGTLNLGSGRSHTISGNVELTNGTLNGGTNTSISITGTGNWNGTGSNFTAGTGTVILAGAAQAINTSTTFNNLSFTGTGAKTIAAALTVTVNGRLTVSNAGIANVFNSLITYGPAATIAYGTSRNTAEEWPATFNSTGGIVVSAGVTATLNQNKVLGTGVSLVVDGNLAAATFNITLEGNVTGTAGAITSFTGTITFTGTASQNVRGFIQTGAGNVVINKTGGTLTFTSAFTTGIGSTFTINAPGATVNMGGSGLTHTFQGNYSVIAATSVGFGNNNISITGTAATQTFSPFSTTGTLTISKTGGTASTTAGTFNAAILNVSGVGGTFDIVAGSTVTLTGGSTYSAGTLNVNGTLSTTGSTTFSGSTTVNVNGTFSTTSTIAIGGGTVNLTSPVTLSNPASTITHTGGTLNVNGTTLSMVSSYTISAGTLAINATGTFTTTGTFATSGTAITNVNGTFTTSNTVTLTLGTINVNAGAFFNTSAATPFSGSATVNANPTSTFNYSGGAQAVRNQTYGNLILSGTGSKTTSASVIVNTRLQLEGTASLSAAITYGAAASLRYNRTAPSSTTNNELPAVFVPTGGVIIGGTGIVTFNAAKNISTTLFIETGAKLNLGTFTDHSAKGLQLNAVPQATGTWGGNTSSATNINTTFFDDATGILTISPPSATWLGTISTDWSTPGNWSTGAVPDLFTDVTIPASTPFSPVLTAASQSSNLTINAGATLNTNGFTLSVFGNLPASGTLTLGASNIVFGGGLAQTIRAITTTGNVSITKTGGTLTFGATVNASGLTVNAPGTTVNMGAFVHAFTGNVLVQAGTVNFGAANATFSSGFTVESGGTVVLGTAIYTFNGNVLVNAGGTLNLNTSSPIFTGNLTNSGGTINGGTSNPAIQGVANQSIAGFTTTGTITFGKNGGTATITGNLGANNFTFNGPGSTVNLGTGSHTIGNITLNAAGSTLQCGSSTISSGGNLTITSGTFDGGSSNLTLTGTAVQTIQAYTTTGNITVSKSGGIATINGNMSANNITINTAGGTLNLGTGTHTLTGNFTLSAGTLATTAYSITFTGTANQSVGVALNTGALGNINVTKTGGTLTFAAPSALTIASFTLNGAGSTVDLGSATHTLSGNLTVTAGTLNANSCSFVFNGTTDQNIAGFTTTGNITLNNTASAATVFFTGSVTAVNLTLNRNGSLNLGTGFTHIFNGTWTRSNGDLDCGGSTIVFTATGNFISGVNGSLLPGTGTVVYGASGNQTIGQFTYNNLSISGSGTRTVTSTSQTIVNGIFTKAGTSTLSAAITYGPSATLQYLTTANITTGVEFPDNFTPSGGVVLAGTGVVTLNVAKDIIGTLTINTGSSLDLNGITTHSCFGLILGGTSQSVLGTYGRTGSGATNTNNTFFAGTNGTITLGSIATTWLGNTFDWFDPNNWSNGVPISVSDATIPVTSVDPIVGGTPECRSLVIDATASVIATSAELTVYGNLTINGDLNIGTLRLNGAASQSIDGFSASGDLLVTKLGGAATLNGDISVTNINISVAGSTLNLGTGHTHTISGNISKVPGSTLTAGSSNIEFIGGTNQNSVGFTTTGNIISNKSGGVLTFTSDFVCEDFTVTGAPSIVNFGTALSNTINGNLTINSGTVDGHTSNLSLAGNITGTGLFDGDQCTLILIGNNPQNVRGFITTGDLRMEKDGSTATLTAAMNAAALVINGPGGTLNMGTSLTHIFTGGVSLNQGTLEGSNSTIRVSASTATAWTGDGSLFQAGTGTVEFSGNNQTINTGTDFNNLTLAGGGSKTFAPGTTTTVNGTLTIANGSSVNTFTGATLAYGASAGLRYNVGTFSRTTSTEWPATFTSTGGITIDGSAGGIITLNESKTLGNNNNTHLTINAGATLATNDFAVTLHGNLVRTGTLSAGSSNFTLAGTNATQSIDGFTTTGILALTKTAGTATLNGNVSAQTLTMNGTGGTLNLGTGRTHTISDGVVLTNGSLIAGNNTLNINGSGATAWSGNSSLFSRGTSTVVFGGNAVDISSANSFHNLTFNGTGTATVTASPLISGNLVTNQPVNFTTGGNTVTFDGSSLQTISGTSNPAFLNLTVNSPGNVQLATNASASGNLVLQTGDLLLTTQQLAVSGTISNTSGRLGAGSGSLVLNGSSSQSLPANIFIGDSIRNLTMNNSAGVVLNSATRLTGNFTPAAGVLTTNNHLTLGSTAAGTARVLTGSASGGYITGTVKVERYMPASRRNWRFLSSQITSATLNNWKDSTHITGPGGATNGFDATVNNRGSVFTYNETDLATSSGGNKNIGWETATNINNPIVVGKGYRVFIRGDRNAGRLTGAIDTQNEITLKLNGTLNQGNISVPLTCTFSGPGSTFSLPNDGWNLVGNPYACDYDWDHFWTNNNANPTFFNNLESDVWVFDPVANNYVTYNASTNTGTGQLLTGIIPSGAAFWVKATTTGPVLQMAEASKTSDNPGSLFKNSRPDKAFRIILNDLNSLDADEAAILYHEKAVRTTDKMDVAKLGGAANLVAISDDGEFTTINSRPPIIHGDTIPLAIKANKGRYSISFRNAENLHTDLDAVLIDNKERRVVDVRNTGAYVFEVDDKYFDEYDIYRFKIIIGPKNQVPAPGNYGITLENAVSLFPNPAQDDVFVRQLGGIEIQSAVVCDLSGKPRYSISGINTVQFKIDTRQWKPGVYIIETTDVRGNVQKQKLIKK